MVEWEGGSREETCIAMADVWQKPAQYFKAIILQLKVNFFKKRKMILVVQGFAK